MAHPLHPIFDAAGRDGRLDDVRRYVEQDAGLANSVDYNGWTPVMYAAVNGRSNVVRYLLDHGAEVNQRNPNGSTALRLACLKLTPKYYEGQVAVVELLLQRGADVTPGDDGTTCLIQAATEGRAEIVGLILAHGGIDLDMMNRTGTALLHACTYGSVEVIMQLLEAGADPAVQRTGAKEPSPFEAAAEGGHQDVMSILQEWDRAYILTRARRVLDDVQKVLAAGVRGPLHVAPAYLRERATAMGSRNDAVELPQVEVRADQGVCDEREAESLAEERRSDRDAEDESQMEGFGGVVARHVLQELSGELFVELMGMCGLLNDDVEDDVEEESGDDAYGDDDEHESASGDSDDSDDDDVLMSDSSGGEVEQEENE